MKDEERAKLWRTLRVAAAILGTLCVVYGFYVNQVIWTAAGLLLSFSSIISVPAAVSSGSMVQPCHDDGGAEY